MKGPFLTVSHSYNLGLSLGEVASLEEVVLKFTMGKDCQRIFLGPVFRDSDSVGLGPEVPWFPGDIDTTGPGTTP